MIVSCLKKPSTVYQFGYGVEELTEHVDDDDEWGELDHDNAQKAAEQLEYCGDENGDLVDYSAQAADEGDDTADEGDETVVDAADAQVGWGILLQQALAQESDALDEDSD